MSRSPLRQGDVILVPISAIPDGVKKMKRDVQGRLVLAEGEVTGHAHAILDRAADLYGSELETRFLRVLTEGGVELRHEEHGPIMIPEGFYEVRIGRVWSPQETRRVYD